MASDQEKVKRLKKELKELSAKDEIAMLKKKIREKKKEATTKLKKLIKKDKTPQTIINNYVASLPQ